jgi:hypothetical protein
MKAVIAFLEKAFPEPIKRDWKIEVGLSQFGQLLFESNITVNNNHDAIQFHSDVWGTIILQARMGLHTGVVMIQDIPAVQVAHYRMSRMNVTELKKIVDTMKGSDGEPLDNRFVDIAFYDREPKYSNKIYKIDNGERLQ